MRTSVLEYDLKGWSVTYSVPIKDKNERIEKTAYFYDKADRKTENSSEKPNNYCDDCLYTDTCDSKEFFYACTSKATISKMEQVEDEPKTQMKTQNSNLTFEKADERCKGCNHYKLTCDLFSEICRYEPKDEPQTERSE